MCFILGKNLGPVPALDESLEVSEIQIKNYQIIILTAKTQLSYAILD